MGGIGHGGGSNPCTIHAGGYGWTMTDSEPAFHPFTDEQVELWIGVLGPFFQRTVRPVVIRRRPSDTFRQYHYGSAQVLRVGTHLILVTAGHNIDEDGKSHLLGLSESNEVRDGQIYWLGGQRRHGWSAKAKMEDGASGRVFEAETDVAVVEVTEEECRRFGFEPISIEQASPRQAWPGEFMAVIGFATANFDVSRVDEGIVVANYLHLASAAVDPAKWHEKWDPSLHRVAEYPVDEVRRIVPGGAIWTKLPESPEGISGCAMWAVPEYQGGLFSFKNAQILGIEYAYFRGMVVGCGMSAVATLIADVWPDTRSVLAGLGWRLHESELTQLADGA